MPNQVLSSVENNFTKGLITEFTGLNFPENAATSTDNCTYTLVGDVVRRNGIDFENNFSFNTVDRTNKAIADYKWNNVGGDGITQMVVTQIGSNLYFYQNSIATVTNPLSQKLVSTVSVSAFVASGGTYDATLECQFADGNGYLFVFHPSCDPFYCTFNGGSVTGNVITLKFRDFAGVPEPGVADSTRPGSLTNEHLYNLLNQGWRNDGSWQANSTTVVPWASLVSPTNVNNTFTVAAGLSLTTSTPVRLQGTIFDSGGGSKFIANGTGVIVSYSGTSLVINTNPLGYPGTSASVSTEQWAITPINPGGQVGTWNASVGGYPSNSDVWWRYTDTTNTFNPLATLTAVTLSSPAPKGSSILNVFNQNRNAIAAGITAVTTTVRPKTGCWYQGRVWYAGTDAQQAASGDMPYTSWTESIYFSQIVNGTKDFGNCYQINDPSSSTLFDLLPTDGGVITIQGCGSIYKLFPLVNALLVFAANGVWYITGSTGIGFTANDYTIVKLSGVKSIGSSSFVDVNGMPYFWNEEGIYVVEPAKQGKALLNSPLHVNPLEVNPITVGTILSFYESIPLESKKYVKGDYNPIDYAIQWVYRSDEESAVNQRYQFDSILNYNTSNQAFFPYTVSTVSGATPYIHTVRYVAGAGGTDTPNPAFKYFSSQASGGSYQFTFAEEREHSFIDWKSAAGGVGANYISYFVTGYKLHGQGQRRFQIPYIYMYSRMDDDVAYKIQSLWDYATSGNSGRWSSEQLTNITAGNFGVVAKRHKLRGQGLTLQIKVTSVDGLPFDIMGWSSFETQNTGV